MVVAATFRLDSWWIVAMRALQRSPRVYVIGETDVCVVQPEYGLGAWLLAQLVLYGGGMTHGNCLLYHHSPDLDQNLDVFLQS